MANSCLHAYNLATRSMAETNSYISRNDYSKRVFLVVEDKKDLAPYEEIIINYNYSEHSEYPDVLLYDRGDSESPLTRVEGSPSTDDNDDVCYSDSDFAKDIQMDDSF